MPSAADATALDGLYYGALFALVAWQLVVFALLRDRTHLLFVGFLASLALSALAWDGLALHYLWPGADAWNRSSLVVFDALAAVFAALFARSYLHTPKRMPGIDSLLRAIVVLAGAAIPLSGPGTWALGLELVWLVTLLGPPILLLAGAAAWHGGFAPARPYLLAHACLLVGLMVEAGATGVDPHVSEWASHGTYVGTLVMAFAVAHGLAVRHREALRERERLEAEYRAAADASRHDGLTELWNRRHFDEVLQQVWRRTLREDGVVSLAMIDVDAFKPLNDTCGHPVGDECLRRIARALAEVAGGRPEHLLARYGGEEFAAILPGLSSEAAARVGESLRAAVAELAIPHPASETAPHVTVSVGVASATPDDDELEPKRLVDAADRALYRAKAEGRDRVCAAD